MRAYTESMLKNSAESLSEGVRRTCEGGRIQDEPHAQDLEEEVPGEHHGGEQL